MPKLARLVTRMSNLNSNINFITYILYASNFVVFQCRTSQKFNSQQLFNVTQRLYYILIKHFFEPPQRRIFLSQVHIPKFQFPVTTTIAASDSKRFRLRFLLSSRPEPARPEEITPVNGRLRSRMAKIASRRGCNSPYKK